MSDRVGDWVQTFTGRDFWPCDPRPEEVDERDLAHALSMICRFTGHVREFYSVAEHSVRVSWAMERELRVRDDPRALLWGLVHDGSEAYLCDVARPVKRLPEFAGYRAIEARVQAAVVQHFGLPVVPPPEVKTADEILLATEYRDLMRKPDEEWMRADWSTTIGHVTPVERAIRPWSPREAEVRWLDRLGELRERGA